MTYEELNVLMLEYSRKRASEFTNRIIEEHPFMCLNGMFVENLYKQMGLCYLQAVLDMWTELYAEDKAMEIANNSSLPKN